MGRTVKAEVLTRLRAALERDLKTAIPISDKARVRTVVLGKFTDEIRGIVLSVHGDHPLGFGGREKDRPTGRRGAITIGSERQWQLPVESVGGSRWETILGTVQIRALKEIPPSAMIEVVETVKARIAQVINQDSELRNITDEYGQRLFALETAEYYGYASGGDNTAVDSHWCDFTGQVSSRRIMS